MNEAQAAAGAEGVRQSAQRRGGQPAPARSRASPPAGRCRCSPTRMGESSEAVAETHWDYLERLRHWGFDVNPLSKRLPGEAAAAEFQAGIAAERSGLGYDIDGVVYKIERSGAATAARLRRARAALGDRLEVPRRAGDDGAAGDPHPGRPHRRADAGGAAGAGECRRRAGAERDAAQRGRDRAQGHPHRRHGGAAARRRRDPADRVGGAGAPAAGCRAVSLSRKSARSAAAMRCARRARRCGAAPAV